MVKCDNCPAIGFLPVRNKFHCGIRCDAMRLIEDNGNSYAKTSDCPLKRIELKDGTVFEPEVVNEKE